MTTLIMRTRVSIIPDSAKGVFISGGPDYGGPTHTPAGGHEGESLSQPLADETAWRSGPLSEPFAGKTLQSPFLLQEHSQIYGRQCVSQWLDYYLREI